MLEENSCKYLGKVLEKTNRISAFGVMRPREIAASQNAGSKSYRPSRLFSLYTNRHLEEYMKIRFPKLDYAEIPGTGHFLMLEKPAEFNRLLLEFLDKLKY